MNLYRTQFFANCPNNGQRIRYTLRIETTEVIPVEQIVAKVESVGDRYHEDLADELLLSLGGRQTLTADHHSVVITTHRQSPLKENTMSIKDISDERAQQSTRFGVDNDDRWSPGEWAALISHYATRSVVGDLGAIDLQKFRQDVVKAGALALACLEAIDRRSAP